jgi:hypothetical protein
MAQLTKCRRLGIAQRTPIGIPMGSYLLGSRTGAPDSSAQLEGLGAVASRQIGSVFAGLLCIFVSSRTTLDGGSGFSGQSEMYYPLSLVWRVVLDLVPEGEWLRR